MTTEQRLDLHAERIARLEGIAEQINERLNGIDMAINGLRGEINGLRGEINGLRGEIRGINNRFFWLFGFLGAMWVTFILAVLFGN